MSKLKILKAATAREEIAALLGYTAKSLAFILFKLPDAAKYTEFEIPKRSGGLRKIKAPTPRLKFLQRRLANLLYDALADIDAASPTRRPLSHGFVPGRSIVTNAQTHKRRRYVLNLDLRDFFPSINFGRVRGVFMKDARFLLNEKVATVIAQIACHDSELPQGSPCSPVVSNIVGHLLDVRLVRLAREHGCIYTRYADDMTFSTNQQQFPAELAAPEPGGSGAWIIGPALEKAINKAGYAVNAKKTRMQMRGSRQVVTGLVANAKVNVKAEYYRTVRSMFAALFATGTYYRMVPATLLGGSPGDPEVKQVEKSLAPLEGMLSHIHWIRDSSDHRDSVEKKSEPSATRVLYHKLLFYRRFVALERPLLIPEGQTDTVYLRAAIERLTAYQPALGVMKDGKLEPAMQFMRYSSKVHELLQLGGGSGDFKHFIINYKKNLLRYRHRPMAHPVIMLIDNDAGADEILKVARNFGAAGISLSSTAPFYRLDGNLYLVKTPETGKVKHMTCIEELFDPVLLTTKLNGKTFDPDKKHDEPGKYGKTKFAEQVVAPQKATIDFSGFAPLLDRVVAVIDNHATALPWTP